jgi:hypothetical protein
MLYLCSRKLLYVVGWLMATLIAVAQTPVTVGYKDHFYSRSGSLTGEKPESKLWWNDGIWWGSLYHPASNGYHIYRFQPATQSWQDTGTALDTRTSSRADVLWDSGAQKLYVASHSFTTNAKPSTSSSNWGRLYRYSYNPSTQTYSKDAGFPVSITRSPSEALTLAKDSTGTLWVTYVEAGKVMVNHSNGDDAQWGTPFVLPGSATATSVDTDDISAIISFDGNKIGVMWSNEDTSSFYFAIHEDGTSDSTWQVEVPLSGSIGIADDHVNLKSTPDGRVFAAVKTSFTVSTNPLVLLLVRAPAGAWSSHTVGRKSDHHTRPIVQIDEGNGRVYVFATSGESGGTIYYKTSDLNNIVFSTGLGTPFIRSTESPNINNATSTKQNTTGSMGLLVAASNSTTREYFHNSLALSEAGRPTIASFTPTSGASGTEVVLTGTGFTNASSVAFNGTAAATFSVDSDSQIRATVPIGASTGKLSVTTPLGTGVSTSDFSVTSANSSPTITSFDPASGPVGTAVTVTGQNFTGATAVTFNGTEAAFTVNSATQLQTTVPAGATSGVIMVTTASGSADSPAEFTVLSASAAPTVTSFSPASGPIGTEVTITGTDFTAVSAVAFNGVSAATYVVDSSTKIRAVVPTSATSGQISVTTNGGTGTSSTSFTVTTSTPTQQTFTINAIADTFVRGGIYADVNYGASSTLDVRNALSADLYRDAYFKFDLNTFTTISQAKFRFWARMGSTTTSLNEIRAVDDTGWVETAVTYNSRPAVGDIVGTVSVSGTTYAWYEVDITSYVQAQKTAGRNIVAIALHGASDPGTYEILHSRQWNTTDAPKLVVIGSQ